MPERMVLFAVMAAIAASALWQAEGAMGSSGFSGFVGAGGSAFSSASPSADKMDEIMKEAMQQLESIKERQKRQAFEGNGSLNNSTMNSTLQNLSAQREKIGPGSSGGVYGIFASRHEMGKSNIKSKMVLNGTFEMDKSVSFQDQGF
ncbi:MAG TPA: hypothetical protein PLQ01_09740 [Methanothrix sp.]|nr:hypothetical protein [Methanothrix sp.]